MMAPLNLRPLFVWDLWELIGNPLLFSIKSCRYHATLSWISSWRFYFISFMMSVPYSRKTSTPKDCAVASVFKIFFLWLLLSWTGTGGIASGGWGVWDVVITTSTPLRNTVLWIITLLIILDFAQAFAERNLSKEVPQQIDSPENGNSVGEHSDPGTNTVEDGEWWKSSKIISWDEFSELCVSGVIESMPDSPF